METKTISLKDNETKSWTNLDIGVSKKVISTDNKKAFVKKPKWIRVKLPTGKKYSNLRGLVDKYKLNTICSSGSCPNMGECWGEGTATFMILGNICTRSCGFCGVKTGRPLEVDWEEPEKVAKSISVMGIKHAVITSVDRDDLTDMGSIIWAETVKSIRRINPGITLETLIPDFQGDINLVNKICEAAPDVLAHNLETVKSLQHYIRPQCRYTWSLDTLKTASLFDINFSLTISTAILTEDFAVLFPDLVCNIHKILFSTVNSTSCISL